MKSLLLLCLMGVAWARPDVSHLSGGYNYNSPSNGFGSSSQPTGSYLPQGGSSNFGPNLPSSGSNNFGQISQPSGSYIPQGNFGGLQGGAGGFNPNSVQDQKHVYFFAAPDDGEQQHLRINVASSGQKNTKIIFVKAPSYGQTIPEVIAPPSQSEDKTLVYVLVKKPEQPGAINIPTSSGVKQAKPEVYFIKYKNPQDAERAVTSSLGGQPAGSSVQPLNDQRAFVSALGDSHNGHGTGGNGFGSLGSGDLGSLGSLGSGSLGSLGNGGLGSLGSSGSGLLGSGSSGTNYGTPGESGPY